MTHTITNQYAANSGADPSADRVNILLVDDQPGKMIAHEAILAELGQNVVKATNGREALECLLRNDFAVILLDVQMPDIDGFETAQLIRQRRSEERRVGKECRVRWWLYHKQESELLLLFTLLI